jgi:uncharacterized repeat protein (TIGR04076 family)
VPVWISAAASLALHPKRGKQPGWSFICLPASENQKGAKPAQIAPASGGQGGTRQAKEADVAQCKITVLKRTFDKELVEQLIRPARQEGFGLCPVFHEGQEFLTDVFSNLPQGFCPWAWDDLYKTLLILAAGGGAGTPYQDPNVVIACCTDGLRPVFFRLEKIGE